MTGTRKLIAAIMDARQAILTSTFREPDGMLYLSVADVRSLDEESKRSGDYFPVSKVKAGDKFTMCGLPAEAADLPPGVAFIGRRIDVNTPTCPHCGQEVPPPGGTS